MDFINTLAQIHQQQNQLTELLNKVSSLAWGVVYDTNDPLSLRRIQVILPNSGHTHSDWLWSISPAGIVPPVPLAGTTVLIGYVDGLMTQGVYLGNLNNALTIPQDSSKDSLIINIGKSQIKITPDGTFELSGEVFKINGKDITTVGAKDSRNDTIITRGY